MVTLGVEAIPLIAATPPLVNDGPCRLAAACRDMVETLGKSEEKEEDEGG